MKTSLLIIISCLFLFSACGKKEEPQPTPSPSVSGQPDPTLNVVTGVVLQVPDEGSGVSSPLDVKGLAPGSWFFEGQLQGEVFSQSGTSLDTFSLTATDDWMTEEHVHFEGTTEFEAPEGDEFIELVIKNDNPSGLPENEKSDRFRFVLEK